MDRPDGQMKELDVLLCELHTGSIDEAGVKRLADLIAASREAQLRYLEAMYFSTGLVQWARQDSAAELAAAKLKEIVSQDVVAEGLPAEPVDLARRPDIATSPQQIRRNRNLRWGGGLVACTLLAVLLAYGLRGPTLPRDDVAKSSAKNAATEEANSRVDYVARIVEATGDVQWAGKSAPFDLRLRIGVGERVAISKGVLRIVYGSGAEIILHGPAVFTPTGKTSGHLSSGQLSGRVADADAVGFRLTTPSADVVDLGTEFGVSIDDDDATDVCVFEGEVEVSANEGRDPMPIRLSEGMSRRIEANGEFGSQPSVSDAEFLRRLPPRRTRRSPNNEFSLVESMIGGAGMSHRLLATIDPNTGKPDEKPMRGGRNADEVGFHHAVYNEFLDGVFIPTRSGLDIQVDSYGNAVNLPPTLARTEGPVWARRPVPNWTPPSNVIASSDGSWFVGASYAAMTRLSECRDGIIGMHANVGLSFDVHSIQSVSGKAASRFRCTIANLDNSMVHRPQLSGGLGSADVRVYVDGELRYELLELRRADGDRAVEFDVGAFCRTLTVVVTDAGDNQIYDQIALIDPVIVLEE